MLSASGITLQEWLEAVSAATTEVAQATLGFDRKDIVAENAPWPEEWSGAYIPLVNEEHSLHLGLLSDTGGCQALARAFLGMNGEDIELPSADVADAIGELVNIVAGNVQTRMSGRAPTLQIGLPIFIRGYIEITEAIEEATLGLHIGPVPAVFRVLRQRP